jgi:hypothetical protein
MTTLLNILFLLPLTLWVGSIFFFSFFTAPTLFRELPKEIAGEFISKLFPQYYTLGYTTLSLAFLSLTFRGFLEKPFPWVRILLLVIMIGCTFYAGTKIHPRAHLVKTVIRSMEDGADKDAKQVEFDKLHRISVILNSVVFLSGILVIGITAVRLYP